MTIAFAVLGGVLAILIAIAAALLTHHTPASTNASAGDILLQGTAELVAFALATWVIGGIALHLSPSELRIRVPVSVGLRGFGQGLALGAVPAAAALLLGVVAGHAFWSPDAGGLGAYVGTVLSSLAVLAPAALGEEVIFRLLPLVLLTLAFGRRGAIAGLAVVFGLAHAGNPGVTPLGLWNIALAGVLLGFAFFAPGGIWTAFGVHLGWNGMLGALDAPVSGIPFRIPMLDYHPGGPAWLTGGSFGPEGGLLATFAIAGAIGIAARWAGKEPG